MAEEKNVPEPEEVTPEDEDLVGLGPEEREALKFIEQEDGTAISASGDEKTVDDGDSKAAEAAAAAAEDEKGGDAPEAAAADVKETDKQPDPERSPEAAYITDAVENFDEKVADLKARKEDLLAKYEEGDIDFSEYNRQRDAIYEEERQIRNQQDMHVRDVQRENQRMANQWAADQQDFFSDKSNEVFRTNPILNNALNESIRSLTSDPANERKSGKWFLEEGRRLTMEAMRQVSGQERPAAPAQPAKPAAPAQEPAKPATQKSAPRIPPNMGDMPTADTTDVAGGGEFAYLDNLKGMEYEMALAAMPKDKQDRYLRDNT